VCGLWLVLEGRPIYGFSCGYHVCPHVRLCVHHVHAFVHRVSAIYVISINRYQQAVVSSTSEDRVGCSD